VPDALRDDVYRRPLATALERLGVGPGWRCVDVGAGGGDVSVSLATMVGHSGRVYAVDSDPRARDVAAAAAAEHSQVLAITQAGEDLLLPEPVDLAFCRFLLLHVVDPAVVLARMAGAVRPGGWVVAQEPVTSAGRVAGTALSMPDARHPDIGAWLPALVRQVGLELVDAWAEAPAGCGPGAVAEYLASLTGVDPKDDPVVLPPLVTVLGRLPDQGVAGRSSVAARD
jgi:SAM-dependent methyltransferase